MQKKTTRKKPGKVRQARLGRGLEALLGDVRQAHSPPPGADEATATVAGKNKNGQLRQLPIEQLERSPYQPRTHMDRAALEELAASIKTQGIVQPLLVRQLAPHRFEIIAGERRWRAAQLAELAAVPAVVREVGDQSAMAVALIENIQREDLNAIEEAAGFQRLLDEFSLTHQQIADAVGRSRAAVTNLLRLLALHPAVKKLLETGKIEMGHARALLALPGKSQPAAANQAAAGLTVRQTEQLVKRLLAGDGDDKGGGKTGTKKSADIQRLEDEISDKLGARVAIQHNTTSKKGKVVVHYHSLDELDGILQRIK